MVRLIMGEKGTGKTKKLIEMINTTAQEDNGSVVCVEAKSTMTFDLHYHVRLISAYEYDLSNYEALRGFLFGLFKKHKNFDDDDFDDDDDVEVEDWDDDDEA